MNAAEPSTYFDHPLEAEIPWKVLIVEDSHDVAVLHQRLVDAMPGFRSIGVASDGESAMRTTVTMRPDLAIVDLSMPGGDGRTFLRQLRAANLNVEVIVVTASRDAQTVREMMHAGVVDYLVKPFEPERLQHAMTTFSCRARALRRAYLAQDDVDLVQSTGAVRMYRPPKGLKRTRLVAVRSILEDSDRPLSAEEVAERIGVARVTARRYLDYLNVTGTVNIERSRSGPGRPLNCYRFIRPLSNSTHP